MQSVRRVEIEEDTRLLAATAQLASAAAIQSEASTLDALLRQSVANNQEGAIVEQLNRAKHEEIDGVTPSTWAMLLPITVRWINDATATIHKCAMAFLVAQHVMATCPDVWRRPEVQSCAAQYYARGVQLLNSNAAQSAALLSDEEMLALVHNLKPFSNSAAAW